MMEQLDRAASREVENQGRLSNLSKVGKKPGKQPDSKKTGQATEGRQASKRSST